MKLSPSDSILLFLSFFLNTGYQFIIKWCKKEYRWNFSWERWVRQGMWEGAWSFQAHPQAHHSSSTSMCLPSEKQPEPHSCGIFIEAPSCRHDWSLTPFPAPLPFLEMEDKNKYSKLPNMGWSFWWPAPTQELTKSHLIWTEDTPFTQEIPKDLGALCQKLGSKTKY